MRKAIINSLPKSGTNLLAECLQLLGYHDAGHIGSGFVLRNTPSAKLLRLLLSPFRQGYIIGIDTPVEIARFSMDQFLRRIKDDRFVTAHVGYTMDLLYRLIDLHYAPMVITRDPRAVLASFVPYVVGKARHPLHKCMNSMPEEERYRCALMGFQNGKTTLQPLKLRCNAITPWISSNEVLHVKFEELIGEHGGGSSDLQGRCLERICTWIDAPRERIHHVTEKLFGAGGRHTFRSGKIDSWRQEIPEAVQIDIARELGEILASWGYQQDQKTATPA